MSAIVVHKKIQNYKFESVPCNFNLHLIQEFSPTAARNLHIEKARF